jgi:site-specific recombinase XerD
MDRIHGRVLKTTTKTKQIRVLPIVPEIEDPLKPKQLGKYVFMIRYRNELIPYSVKILEKIWWEANKKATKNDGVQKIKLYNAFRHSFACQRLNSDTPMETLKEILGHTCVETTRRYAQYKISKLVEVMRNIKSNVISLHCNQSAPQEK